MPSAALLYISSILSVNPRLIAACIVLSMNENQVAGSGDDPVVMYTYRR